MPSSTEEPDGGKGHGRWQMGQEQERLRETCGKHALEMTGNSCWDMDEKWGVQKDWRACSVRR